MADPFTALLASKYRSPNRRPGVVPRARLIERLDGATPAALTLVSAPAGFGKSTLLAEWLDHVATSGTQTAWLSLDDRDNEPRTFWTYVLAAVDSTREDARQLLQSSPPATEAALAALINELSDRAADVVLVLDDYHLIESAEVHAGMQFLLEHRPPRLRIVIATRIDPALPLARLRARGELVEIRAADLRFTEAEAAAYLNGTMALGLGEPDIASLDARTEGWIAALQLAALSLRGRDDASAFIAGFAGDDRYVVDYLVDEVLARQRPEVRDFLLETSILHRLTGALCDAVTGRPGGRSTLAALDRANLFLIPLDDKRQWYRYHHLFADVLQAHLAEERADDVPALHARAGVWLAAHGDPAEAVRHALAGGDPDRAAELMELAIPVMRRDRRETDLTRWARALPADVAGTRPVLALAFVGALAQVSDFAAAEERLTSLERALREAGGDDWPRRPPAGMTVVDEAAYQSVPAGIELYRAALALARGDLDATVTHAGTALTLAPPGDDLTRAAAGALGGLAAWTTGDLAAAHTAYSETVDGLRRAGSVADVLGCCITLGDICRTQGDLRGAVDTYERALDLAASVAGAEPVRGTADMHVGLAEVALERGDLHAAAEHLARSERLGEGKGLPQNPYRQRVVTARLREAEGDLDAALRLLDEAERVYVADYSPNVRPVPAVRARLLVRRGELDAAAAWAAGCGLTPTDDVSYLREYEHVTLARLLLARHRTERDAAALAAARSLIERLLAAAEAGGRGGTVIELLVLQALAADAEGDPAAALAALQRGVVLAQPSGYVRLFTDAGPRMAALLTSLTRTAGAPAHARRLLAATSPTAEPAATPATLVVPLSERELDVLRWLATDLEGPEIARRLSVSLNTVRTHTKNIYAKLGVTNRRTAVRQAHELDLLPRR